MPFMFGEKMSEVFQDSVVRHIEAQEFPNQCTQKSLQDTARCLQHCNPWQSFKRPYPNQAGGISWKSLLKSYEYLWCQIVLPGPPYCRKVISQLKARAVIVMVARKLEIVCKPRFAKKKCSSKILFCAYWRWSKQILRHNSCWARMLSEVVQPNTQHYGHAMNNSSHRRLLKLTRALKLQMHQNEDIYLASSNHCSSKKLNMFFVQYSSLMMSHDVSCHLEPCGNLGDLLRQLFTSCPALQLFSGSECLTVPLQRDAKSQCFPSPNTMPVEETPQLSEA